MGDQRFYLTHILNNYKVHTGKVLFSRGTTFKGYDLWVGEKKNRALH